MAGAPDQARRHFKAAFAPLRTTVLVNQDGHLDMVAACRTGMLSAALGDGANNFERPVNYPSGSASHIVKLADFDLDGDLDAVTTNSETDDVSLLTNQALR